MEPYSVYRVMADTDVFFIHKITATHKLKFWEHEYSQVNTRN